MKVLFITVLLCIASYGFTQAQSIGTVLNNAPSILDYGAAKEYVKQFNQDAKDITDLRIEWSPSEKAFLLIARVISDRAITKAYTLTQKGALLAPGTVGISEFSCQSDKCIECEMVNDACSCKSGNQDCYRTKRVIL